MRLASASFQQELVQSDPTMLRLFQPFAKRWLIWVGVVVAVFVPPFAMADPVQITTRSTSIFPDGSSLSFG